MIYGFKCLILVHHNHINYFILLCFTIFCLLVMRIVDDDCESRGGQKGVSVASHTQILGIFQNVMLPQAKEEKRKRDNSF